MYGGFGFLWFLCKPAFLPTKAQTQASIILNSHTSNNQIHSMDPTEESTIPFLKNDEEEGRNNKKPTTVLNNRQLSTRSQKSQKEDKITNYLVSLFLLFCSRTQLHSTVPDIFEFMTWMRYVLSIRHRAGVRRIIIITCTTENSRRLKSLAPVLQNINLTYNSTPFNGSLFQRNYLSPNSESRSRRGVGRPWCKLYVYSILPPILRSHNSIYVRASSGIHNIASWGSGTIRSVDRSSASGSRLRGARVSGPYWRAAPSSLPGRIYFLRVELLRWGA